MIRLVPAAFLALAVHAILFWVEVPWSRPALTMRQSRAVSIDLIAYQKPAPKPEPPEPKVVKPRPNPLPRPKPKPVVKPEVPPQPKPEPVLKEPLTEHSSIVEALAPDTDFEEAPPEADPTAIEDLPADEADDRAAVQASVPLYHLNPAPQYPRLARRRNYQGAVVLDVRVTIDGLAANIRIAESSGYAILDRSAVKAVRGWRFSPAMRGGRPFEMWVQVPVRFELR